MTAYLTEEHSTSTLATERLEAETAQRMKLDKEIQDLQAKFRQMSAEHEKLEMEVLVTRSAGLNGDGGMTSGSNFGDADEEEEDDGTSNVFRQKCERLTISSAKTRPTATPSSRRNSGSTSLLYNCCFFVSLSLNLLMFSFSIGSTRSCSCCRTSCVKSAPLRSEQCGSATLPSPTSLASNKPCRSVCPSNQL